MSLSFVMPGLTAISQTFTPITVNINANCGGYMEYLPAGYTTNTTKKYPTIVYIHGGASFGSGSTASLLTLQNVEGVPLYIANGQFPKSIVTPYGDTASFIAISPQFKTNPSTPQDIKAVIDYVLAHYRVDTYRLYLTGYSLGGGAVWQAPFNQAQANRLAAMVPVAAYNLPFYDTTAKFIVGANVAVWAIHSTTDQTAPYTTDVTFIAKLDSLHPKTPPVLTLVSGLSHDTTVTVVYNPNFRPNGKNIYEWMLQYAKFYPPTAIVGKDTSIVLPANSLSLSGSRSTDPQNESLTYQWTRTSGPSEFILSNASAANPVISGLIAGKYSIRLTVTDSAALTSSATQNIFVINPNAAVPPIASAGRDTTILLPQSSITLNGSSSSAPNGAIETYAWIQSSGPTQAVIANPAAAITTASNLRTGTYQFQLTIVDNLDSTAKAAVNIHVINPFPNIPPIARAGADQTISLPTNSITPEWRRFLRHRRCDHQLSLAPAEWPFAEQYRQSQCCNHHRGQPDGRRLPVRVECTGRQQRDRKGHAVDLRQPPAQTSPGQCLWRLESRRNGMEQLECHKQPDIHGFCLLGRHNLRDQGCTQRKHGRGGQRHQLPRHHVPCRGWENGQLFL